MQLRRRNELNTMNSYDFLLDMAILLFHGKASWNNRDFVLGMVTKNWRDLRRPCKVVIESQNRCLKG